MKVSMLWVSYFVVGTALMDLSFSLATTSLSISDAIYPGITDGTMMEATSRKLKENSYNPNIGRRSNAENFNLDDYHPVDPVPSSKASIKPGPIEHGTPLNPYIPKPLPPPTPRSKKVGQLP